MIKKYKDVSDQIEAIKKLGTQKGDTTGFRSLDKLFTVKQGSYTFVLGAPHHGKSELSFELALTQQRIHKKRSLISSSETGSVADIYIEIIHKVFNKSIFKDHPMQFTSYDDFKKAVAFVDTWFSIVDTEEKSYSFGELFEMRTDEKIILADPYNEHKHDMVGLGYGSRQDLYIEDLMGEVRRANKKMDTHMIISLHPAAQQLKEDKINGQSVRYYPMPLAREASGGQSLFRKAMTWINVWRPPVGLKGHHGLPYEANEMVYMIEKAKPKGVAVKGMGSLYYDYFRSRYYEKIGNHKCFSEQHLKFPENDISTDDKPPF